MSKHILILFWTHGDEYRLKGCLDIIDPYFSSLYDTLDVNEYAIEKSLRYREYDMNRTAPWDIHSDSYELRRGAEVQEIMRWYTIVIDIHGTDSDTGSFVLLPRATPEHILGSMFQSENIVLWQSAVRKPLGPIVAFHPLWLEIETWPMNDTMMPELARNLSQFFLNYQRGYTMKELFQILKHKRIYTVVARLDYSRNVSIPEKDF